MILVSDYDRTLKINDVISDYDRMMIKQFENKGHIFCVNSGRSVQHLLQNFEIQGFSAQYIICGSGSQIYNKEQVMLHQDFMENEDVKALLRKITASKAITYQVTSNTIWIHERRDSETWFETVESSEFEEINSVSCKFESVELAEMFCKEIAKQFEVSPYQNGLNIDIAPKRVSKATGIHRLKEILEIEISDIFTIGDSLNDIEMIEEFGGFCVKVSHPRILEISQKSFDSVGKCIEYLLKHIEI